MKYSKTFRFLFVAALTVAFSAGAFAQATRTWVSGVGDDANPCSRTAPCKTFAGAISKTAPGGEISVLDPGGFGTINITKSITINGTGTLAGILAANTNGVIVNAPLATDTIIIRDVSINGANTTTGNGIRYIAGGSLMVDHCWIYGFRGTGANGRGIAVEKTSDGNLKVIDTVIENCGQDGIRLTTTAGLIEATLDNCTVTGTATGLHVLGNARAVARGCVFSNNTANGVFAESPTAGQFAVARVWQSAISFNNTNGVQAGTGGGSSIVEIAQNQISNNASNGVLVSANGTVNTFSNNAITGNGTDGCPGCTPVGPGN